MALQRFDHAAQGGISGQVPVSIVNFLEVIQIQHDQAERLPGGARLSQQLSAHSVQITPVISAGERVAVGLFLQLYLKLFDGLQLLLQTLVGRQQVCLQAPLLADILLDGYITDDGAPRVAHRGNRLLLGIQVPVFMPVGDLALPGLPGLDRLPQLGIKVPVVQSRFQQRKRATADFLGRIASQLRKGRVDPQADAAQIADGNRMPGRLQGGAKHQDLLAAFAFYFYRLQHNDKGKVFFDLQWGKADLQAQFMPILVKPVHCPLAYSDILRSCISALAVAPLCAAQPFWYQFVQRLVEQFRLPIAEQFFHALIAGIDHPALIG